MRGAYPAILDDPRLGAAARDLHRDALALLDRIVAEGRLTAERGRRLLAGEHVDERRHRRLVRRRARSEPRATFRTLRQQMAKPDGRPNVALADFVAPAETGRAGLHRRLRGHGRTRPRRDRRASSRRPTTTTRRSSPRPSPTAWPRPSPSGCTSACGASCGATRPTRRSSNTDLIAERYQGIRPAPGYPACPDHTAKGTLFELLEAEPRAGIQLTESFAMWPGASVSGLLPVEPRQPLLRRSGGSGATSWRTTPPGRACRSPRPSAGWRRTWPTRTRRSGRVRTHDRAELVAAFAAFPARLAAAAEAAVDVPVPAGEWGPSEVVRHLVAVERVSGTSGSPRSRSTTIRTGTGPSPARRLGWTARPWNGSWPCSPRSEARPSRPSASSMTPAGRARDPRHVRRPRRRGPAAARQRTRHGASR